MRSSDKTKTVLENSHDKQIFDSRHDQIMVWLYERLKSDLGGHGEAKWFVCAPEFSGSKILAEQGIGFIPYEPSCIN